jgi:hypothetical protein
MDSKQRLLGELASGAVAALLELVPHVEGGAVRGLSGFRRGMDDLLRPFAWSTSANEGNAGIVRCVARSKPSGRARPRRACADINR